MPSTEWQKIEESVQTVLGTRNAFLVEMKERREGGRRIVQVFVDTDDGITIAQCAEISRELGVELDAQNSINESYELEVSSPGMERPLKLLRQYRKNLGRKFKVQWKHGDEQRTLHGTLGSIDGEVLTFITDKQEKVSLEFSKITESIEELPW